MSDELKALQDTATQARAKADELVAALTSESSEEEQTDAKGAEQAAIDAESAFAEAKAKAEADAAAQSGSGSGPKTGDSCVCPDGRPGTVHVLDEGLICLPNQG
jgi:hypothetical protein